MVFFSFFTSSTIQERVKKILRYDIQLGWGGAHIHIMQWVCVCIVQCATVYYHDDKTKANFEGSLIMMIMLQDKDLMGNAC